MNATTRPNVLILLTDSTRADHLGCCGDPMRLTPNLDRLAHQGIRFDRSYATTPLCHPARSALLTGLYPHRNGTLGNGLAGHNVPRLDQTLPTLYTRLADAGYHCALAAQHEGLNPAGIAELRAGYEPFKARMRQQGFPPPGDPAGSAPTPPEGRILDDLDQVRDYTYIRDGLELLDTCTRQPNPWLLAIELDGPHAPCLPLRTTWERVDPDAIPMPQGFDHPLDDRAPRYARTRAAAGWDQWPTPRRRDAVRLYRAVLAMHDDFLGQVLDRLDARNAAANTLVIFSSDHGEYVGELGLFSKFSAMSECVLRTPLVMRWPQGIKPGRVCRQFVSSVDWMPTLCELAGIAPPQPCHGRSLRPLFLGQTPQQWRQGIACTYHGDGRRMYTLRSWRDDRHKYVWDPFGRDELFDLQHDPHEQTNLIQRHDMRPIVHALARDMHAALAELHDPVATPAASRVPSIGAWIEDGLEPVAPAASSPGDATA